MRAGVSCISAWDMHFKTVIKCKVKSEKFKKIFFVFLLSIFYFQLSTFNFVTAVNAEVLERVVAIVDDDIITLSEFKDAVQTAVNSGAKTTETEVLNGMINRILLLREAKKFRLEDSVAGSQTAKDNGIINDYIEKRLKALIRISPEEIELFYEKNKKSFGNKDFYDVRDEIEEYLIEKELNNRLIKHIEELRKNAYIVIQLKD